MGKKHDNVHTLFINNALKMNYQDINMHTQHISKNEGKTKNDATVEACFNSYTSSTNTMFDINLIVDCESMGDDTIIKEVSLNYIPYISCHKADAACHMVGGNTAFSF